MIHAMHFVDAFYSCQAMEDAIHLSEIVICKSFMWNSVTLLGKQME